MAIGTWFRTDFDEVGAALDLPAVVTGGQGDEVRVVDQVVRGVAIVGRLTGDSGAVGLKVNTSDQGVRVTVRLSLDDVATYWWSDRVKPPPGTPERPRLVVVRSQGAVRGAAVLARRQGRLRAGTAAATVAFDLPPSDLALPDVRPSSLARSEVARSDVARSDRARSGPGADGLIMVELCGPGPLPTWAAGRFADRGAVGLRIDRISVDPIPPDPAAPARAEDAPPATDTHGGCAFAVLGTDEAVVRLRLATVPPAPPIRRAPTNRWTRRKPARAAAKILRLARRVAGRAIADATSRRRPGHPVPYAVDLVTGESVAVHVVGRDPDGIDLRIDPATGPVLLGLDDGRRRERSGRQLACSRAPRRPAATPPGAPQ